jgi:hypothetical protein
MAKSILSTARRALLREIMALAWRSYRMRHLPGCNIVTFADALRNAWSFTKARALPPVVVTRTVELRSPIRSPIRNVWTGPYGEARARSLGRITSAVGC